MLTREDYLMITERRRQGAYIKDIAHELGGHPRTVRRALARGSEPPRRPKRRPSKLDAYKTRVDEMLTDGIWNAEVIYRDIRKAGYTGKLSILRAYIRPKRKLRPSAGTVRYETPPGYQLQHDWAERFVTIAGERQKVYLAVNVLGYARGLHVVGMPRYDAEHTYEAVIQAFEAFGGVTATVLVDNQKSAVLEWVGGKPRFNARFREMGRHYGFTPKACRPKRPQTKGKVERMVSYVAGNALAGSNPTFDSWGDLNAHLRAWSQTVANRRFHRELGEPVDVRLGRELPRLKPLPHERFDTAYRGQRMVSLDAYVSIGGVRYSVPGHLVGQRLTTRIQLDGWIELSDLSGTVVARHRQVSGDQRVVTIAEHHSALWNQVRVQARDLGYYAEMS
jgi:transposase